MKSVHRDVQALVDAVPVHSAPHESEPAWAASERRLGISFPPEFKDLVDVFGSGPWAGFLHVLSPFADDELLFERAALRALGAFHTTRRSSPAAIPFAIFPEPLGLLPWGVTDNGDTLCWLTEGVQWPTIILPARGGSWERHDLSVPRLLAAFLDGSLGSKLLLDPFEGELPIRAHRENR